jgi:hypothetical protein
MSEVVTTDDSSVFEMATPPGTLGGRDVDENGVNAGLLRCPRCTCRLMTGMCKLVEKEGAERTLWIPRPIEGESDKFNWESVNHTWWWEVADVDDFNNVGMSKEVEGPEARVKIVLCPECGGGPLGHQMVGENKVFVACDTVLQQDKAAADDKKDFGVDESNPQFQQIKSMVEQQGLASQFNVVFEEGRLGMMLDDAPDGVGVEVYAFTEGEGGEAGAAELSGKVQVLDKIVKVHGVSTKGMGFSDVLDLICSAPRPLELRFERKGDGKGGAEAGDGAGGGPGPRRVKHEQWEITPAAAAAAAAAEEAVAAAAAAGEAGGAGE